MVDLLAIVAHPDDAELGVAGVLLKQADRGGSFAIVDLTRGERGTRGSAELRTEETRRANAILGIDEGRRWNLEIPDGGIADTDEHIARVVRAIRYFRPRTLLFPWREDRHPDHQDAHRLIHRSLFEAGLTARVTEHDGRRQEPFRPSRSYCFFHTYETTPMLVVDISEQLERKLEAIAAYGSQFTVPGRTSRFDTHQPHTFISGEGYVESLIARMRHWGFMAGVPFAEAFMTLNGPVLTETLVA